MNISEQFAIINSREFFYVINGVKMHAVWKGFYFLFVVVYFHL